MSSSKRDFDKTKYIYFGEKWRIAWTINEFGIKSAMLLKKDLIVNLLKMKNIKEKPAHTFRIIKY